MKTAFVWVLSLLLFLVILDQGHAMRQLVEYTRQQDEIIKRYGTECGKIKPVAAIREIVEMYDHQ